MSPDETLPLLLDLGDVPQVRGVMVAGCDLCGVRVDFGPPDHLAPVVIGDRQIQPAVAGEQASDRNHPAILPWLVL